jgi:ParB-like chromosome segregation protein Spo0J
MVAAGACLDKQRHPLSAAFGDMPADEFAELVADIKRNGQISDIVKAADGSILDGWHRYRACIEAGIKPRIEPFSYIVEAASEVSGRTMTEAEFVIAQNAHRRHLTAEQRRRVVAELLKADPAKSDRAIGSMAKVDHKTVAAVRRKVEGSGEIPQTSERKYSDGRTLTMPAKVQLSRSERKAVERVLEQKRQALLAEQAALSAARQPEPAAPPAADLPPAAPSNDIHCRTADEAAARAALPKLQLGHVRLDERALRGWRDELYGLAERIGHYLMWAERLGNGDYADIEIDEIGDITFDMVKLAEEIDETAGNAERHDEYGYSEAEHG